MGLKQCLAAMPLNPWTDLDDAHEDRVLPDAAQMSDRQLHGEDVSVLVDGDEFGCVVEHSALASVEECLDEAIVLLRERRLRDGGRDKIC